MVRSIAGGFANMTLTHGLRATYLALAPYVLAFALASGCSGASTPSNLTTNSPLSPALAPPATVGDQGPAGQVMPSLKTVPAPSWVKRGLRLTYEVNTATVKGTGSDWKPDENGLWKTEDGRRWSPGEKGEGAARGFMQFDVVEVRPEYAVILASFYLVPLSGLQAQLSFQYPIVGPAGSAGGLWVNPSELKKLKNGVTKDFKVLRKVFVGGGKARPAVWIQSLDSRGNKIYVYDEDSGMLLHDATCVEGAPSQAILKTEVSNTPSVTFSDGTLVASRIVNYPWADSDATGWAATAPSLAYRGTTLVPTGGLAPLRLDVNLTAQPKTRGESWVHYGMLLKITNTGNMPTITTPSETITGLGQFGGAWLPPAILANLTEGQRIDYDAITLVTVKVLSTKGRTVVIAATNPTQNLRWGYDKTSGLMTTIEKDELNPVAPIKTKLTLMK